jgi:arabinan endo-1,5-alpha-L-arabinosidase
MLFVLAGCSKTINDDKKTDNTKNTDSAKDELDKDNEEAEEKSEYSNVKLMADEDVKYKFSNVSVHDPSIIKANGSYYVFGSHLGAAKTDDLMNWSLIASGVNKTNPLFDDVTKELKETLEYAQTDTLWAPDVIQLEDGKYYMYYCACVGNAPISTLGIAVSDNVDGPYKDLGIILKSGMDANTPSEDGDTYNAAYQPNAVDPCVFFDKEGKLWMMYGSYSGGIFILELDPKTGFPLEKGYGKKLLGANHLRIEGSYVMYSEETDYYYMFLSYGGLASDGGYNIRVSRSKNPDGPYVDSDGDEMINCKGKDGTVFDDSAMTLYGTKILGNIKFKWLEGENNKIRFGYVSPGHCSVIKEDGKYFLVFHTRFESKGEGHEVRVHQLFLNEDGWFVVAPYRYTGETIADYDKKDIVGTYKFINQGVDTSATMKESVLINLNEDGTVTGEKTGTWEMVDGHNMTITIKDMVYKGVFLKQWDEYGLKNVMTFTALSENGVSVLGSGIEAK